MTHRADDPSVLWSMIATATNGSAEVCLFSPVELFEFVLFRSEGARLKTSVRTQRFRDEVAGSG